MSSDNRRIAACLVLGALAFALTYLFLYVQYHPR